MIGNLVIELEAAEPTITEMKFDLLAQLPFKADAIAVANNEHPDHQLRIDRGPPDVAVERRQLLAKIDQSCNQSSSLFSSLLSRFRYSPVERFFYKFDGIDCCPKLNAKLVNRLFHRWWQVAPPINSVTHCFLGGCYHLIDNDIEVGLRNRFSS